MANVRVAVRVRPLSKRETKEGGRIIVEVDGKLAKIRNLKVDGRSDGFGDSREKVVAFGFDYCYWSVNPEDPQYASQEVVFQDLGTEVLSGAAEGYNICLFAYGQTGSGKTHTMLGTPASVGLTPRICEGLFVREEDYAPLPSSCRIKVSFLEIYNERVRDLLKPSDQKKSYTLRVREHPELGPYVQGLSQHIVTNYKQVIQLLEEGIANRITAATHVHEASSRSHAIFTIHYTQAVLENSLPSEISSKINLVDLAGSERADPSYCKDRITEGANINKSLVTLGIVISTLAQNAQVFSSCQSLNSVTSTGGDSGTPGSPSGTSGGGGPSRRQSYIPYRDSVLTWLLKDSLGGNSKTIMVATVSPAHTSYSETMSTLRYASNAKNIVNKPRVNEDANVKLIRELREEIRRLKALLLSFELRNFSSLAKAEDGSLQERVLQSESKIDRLTQDWAQKWDEWKALVEHYRVDINKGRAGVVIDSSLPHLMALEDDMLSTGVVLYHLKEGTTKIGRIDSEQEQDIVLQGQWIERDHCTITSACGVVVLRPAQGARCTVNGREVTASCRLTQGAVITLGKARTFRFSHPAEAAVLRQRRQVGEAVGGSGSLEWLNLDGDVTACRLGLRPSLWEKRTELREQSGEDRWPPRAGETPPRTKARWPRQRSVGDLRQQILTGPVGAERDLDVNQARVPWQIKDNQQWQLREETWLANSPQQQQKDRVAEEEPEASVPADSWLQTDPETRSCPLAQSQKRAVLRELLRRPALRAAERNIRRKKVWFQLQRVIKKPKLLEAHKRLEHLRAHCWLQDDCPQESPHQAPSSDAMVPGPQCGSRSTSCSSLSLRGLCLRYLPQLRSVFLHRDASTTLSPVPGSTDQTSEKTQSEEGLPQAASYPPRTGHLSKNVLRSSGEGQLCTARAALARRRASAPGFTMSSGSSSAQEMESVGKQPHWMAPQGSACVGQPAHKLKPRDEPEALTPSTQTRRAKGPSGSGHGPARSRQEGDLETHKAAKGADCSSSHPHGPKQAAGHGKAAKTFWAESKPPSPSRTSKGQQRVPAARVRDITKKSSRLLRGSPLRRRRSAGGPDTTASLSSSSPAVDHTGEQDADLSDAGSSYSVDSLSCVYAKALTGPLGPGPHRGKERDLPETENTESDNSQMSEDSLAEKGHQSPRDSPGDSYLTSGHGCHRARAAAPARGLTTSSDSGPLALAHRSFSLDSLVGNEEEPEGDRQEEPFFASADEMPAETFWHLQTASLPAVGQEALCRPGPVSQRAGGRLDATLLMSSSFCLDSQLQPQPHCEWPEAKVEASSSEQANTLLSTQVSRGSPLLSLDSWFSCDSKVNPSSPLGIVGSLCPSPNVQEFHPSGRERPGCWPRMEGPEPSGAEADLPHTCTLPPGGAELPCSVRAVYTIPASDTSRLSLWGSYRLLQPGAGGTFQATSVPGTAQQGDSETSNSSRVPSTLAASAVSLTRVGRAHERDWAALQRKYLLELSHPDLEAIGQPRPALTSLEEDAGSLAQASGKEGDSLLAVGSGVSSSLNFHSFPIHVSKSRHRKSEKEQVSLSVELEGASDFFTASEKEVSYSGNYSADVESLTSGTANAQVFAAENKGAKCVIAAGAAEQNSSEASSQSGGGKPGLTTSSDEQFFLENPCHNVTIAAKEDHRPQGWAPLRKNSAGPAGRLNHIRHQPRQEEEADCPESREEEAGGRTSLSCAFPWGPELYLHSAPWSSFPSALQPPPLETFYVAKSRDALTETALEIPACREARAPSPPPREAWGFGPDYQVLQNVYLKNNLSVPLQKQCSKSISSQQVTVERPADLNTKEVSGEVGTRPGNVGEESRNSVYHFVAQNRHFLSSASTEVCDYENQVGNGNKHSLPAPKEGGKVTIQSRCSLSSDGAGPGEPLPVGASGPGGEEEQGQSAVPTQTSASDVNGWLPSGAGCGLLYKTISLHPKDSAGERELPWTASTSERFQSVRYSQERDLAERKGPGKSEVMSNPKEPPSGKKQNKRVSNADEMARLIKSVMQLENDILEIESKQNKQLYASHTLGVGNDLVFQEQETAEHVLGPGSSGNRLSFKGQPSSPKQTDDALFGDGEAGGMKAGGSTGGDARVQNGALSSFESREWVQDVRFVSERSPPALSDRPARDTFEYSGTCTAHGERTTTSVNPWRVKAPARAAPLQARPEWASAEENEAVRASAGPGGQPCASGSLEESGAAEGFQESQRAKHISSFDPEGLSVQSRVKEMTMQRGESPGEEYRMVSPTQKLLGPSQHCTGTFLSQDTGPLLSWPCSSVAPHQDPSHTLPSNSPRLTRSCLHALGATGISSVDYVLDPTVLKMPNSPWGAEAGRQGQCGEPRSRSPQGTVPGNPSGAHTAGCGSASFTAMGSWGHSSAWKSIPPGAEGRRPASPSPRDQGWGPRSTSMGLSTRVCSAAEAEAAVQEGTERASFLNRVSSPLEKRATCPLEGGDDRGWEVRQKAEKKAEDLSPNSATISAPAPLGPQLEPWARAPAGPAVSEEIRETGAHGKQLQDLVAEGTVLPRSETLSEPECSSRAPSRPRCQQMNQPASDRTRNDSKAQGPRGTPQGPHGVGPGHHWTDEREVLKATPPSADSFQPLPDSDVTTGPWQPSQAFPQADPAPGCHSGELRHFLSAGEQFVCYSGPFETIEEKKVATGIPSAGPVGSDSLPSSTALGKDRRVIPEQGVAALSSQDPSEDPGVSRPGQSRLVPGEAAEGAPPGSQESSQARREPGIPDTTDGGGSRNCVVAAQSGKGTCSESQLVICDVQNPASLPGPNQDHAQDLGASKVLEKGSTNLKQGTVLAGVLRRVELEAPSQQCVREEGVGSGPAEACRPGSKHPRPTPLPDQRPGPDPGGAREEAPCGFPQATSECAVFSGTVEGRRTLSPSGERGDSRTLPRPQPCDSQPAASRACSSPPGAAPQTLPPPCTAPSRACGMGERGESYCSEPDVFLAHGLEPEGVQEEAGPTGGRTWGPSAAAVALSLAQGCGSPSAPDVRTSSLSYSVAGGDPEKKVAEKEASAEPEAAPLPDGVCSEPLRTFQDSSVGGQSAQDFQTKPELPAATGGQRTLNLGEEPVESELPMEPQHGHLENAVTRLPEKLQLSTESEDHGGLDPQDQSVAKLSPISGPRVGSPREGEEQQREPAAGGGEDPAQGGSDGCQTGGACGGQGAAAKAPASQTFSSGFNDSASVPSGPGAQSPGQPSSGREQPAPHHRRSLPVIAMVSGPGHSRAPPRPHFSIVSSSLSLQELNLSVEPPSPTEEETQEPNTLWNSHSRDHSEESAVGTPRKAEGCNQKVSSDSDSGSVDYGPLQPASPPYPSSLAPSWVPAPDFVTPRMSGAGGRALAGQARPEKGLLEADKGGLCFGSGGTRPQALCCHLEGPAGTGWRRSVFGSAVHVACRQTSQGPVPPSVSQCPSTDDGPEDQNSFRSHLSIYANARGLASCCSSTENARGSHEAWEAWDSSLALGNPRSLMGPDGAAPTKGPDKRVQFLGTPDEAGCARSDPRWAGGGAAGPVDEMLLLCSPELGSPVGQAGVDALEQDTQTLGCRPPWSHTDLSAPSEASSTPVSDLASWASMHNLSFHLSQLLHSTSELLGSLSQPSAAGMERHTKRETPEEAPQTLTMDGCTQTTVDKGVQTDLASPPLHLPVPEASPPEVRVVLEMPGSDVSTMSREKGHVPGTLQKSEAEETAWKTAGPPELHEEGTHCRPQSPPAPSCRWGSQKAPSGQNLPSVSPQASPDDSPPPGSQPEEPSCLAGRSPGLSDPHSPGPGPSAAEAAGEPRAQKELCPMGALLVDRASSPILTLSASTQGLGLPLGPLSLSAPTEHPPEGHQELVSSPDPPRDASRPPVDDSQTIDESGGAPRVGLWPGEDSSSLERNGGRSVPEARPPGSPQHSSKIQVRFLEQPDRQPQPRTTAWVQSRAPLLPLGVRGQRPAQTIVPEDVAPLEGGPLSSTGPPKRQRTENGGRSSASPGEPQPTPDSPSSWGGPRHLSPCAVSASTEKTRLQGSASGPAGACHPRGLLRPRSQNSVAPEPQHHSLRDLPVHNKFSNWHGVRDGSPGELAVVEVLGSRHDLGCGERGQNPSQLHLRQDQSQDPGRSQREQIPLHVGAQNLSLSVELTEAKLHRGFGESDALLRVLQTGTGEALAAEDPVPSTWGELYARQKQTIETLRRQRAERLQNFRRARSLSPQKQLSLQPNRDLPARDLDLPSRRREYLQQLRKDVVETTRSPGSASRSAHPPSDIELMLREYQRAREEAKVEIARARDRLRERTEQEKLRIRQQIVSQLLREEEKLHTLAASSSLCTSSSGSLSSGVTSGYNSSPALSGQLLSPGSVGDADLPDSGDSWMGDTRGRSAVRNSHPNLAGSAWKSVACSRRASLGSCCCSSSSVSSLGTSFSSCYQDLAKHIVDISVADVMAACSEDLDNLFSGQAAAGWNYRGEEQEVQLYYQAFSSTRHGFLGAGVLSQPLSHVWAAVSDPTLWPLYHKPIQTARLHQRVTNSISLVYLVCNPALCALKQPRDFCCVCVEAKEGHLSIMAAQSVYDTSMPRPSRDMVRGEILPSAWILQPLVTEGKEMTRVVYLAQIELGAPGSPPHLLSSFTKQQPLVIARLASFLGS